MTGVFPTLGSEETETHSLGLPTCNISSDLDCCIPFFLFPRPPLGLADHGQDVGASLGFGDSSKREPEGRCQAWGVPWMGIVSIPGKGAVPWQLCVVSLSIQDKPQTQHSIWQMGKNRTKFAPFLKKWTQGSQARLHSWSFSFLNKPPGF